MKIKEFYKKNKLVIVSTIIIIILGIGVYSYIQAIKYHNNSYLSIEQYNAVKNGNHDLNRELGVLIKQMDDKIVVAKKKEDELYNKIKSLSNDLFYMNNAAAKNLQTIHILFESQKNKILLKTDTTLTNEQIQKYIKENYYDTTFFSEPK